MTTRTPIDIELETDLDILDYSSDESMSSPVVRTPCKKCTKKSKFGITYPKFCIKHADLTMPRLTGKVTKKVKFAPPPPPRVKIAISPYYQCIYNVDMLYL